MSGHIKFVYPVASFSNATKSDIFQPLLLQKDVLPHCKIGSSSIPVEKTTLLSLLTVFSSQLEGCDLSQLVPGGENQQFLIATVTVMKDSCLDVKTHLVVQ